MGKSKFSTRLIASQIEILRLQDEALGGQGRHLAWSLGWQGGTLLPVDEGHPVLVVRAVLADAISAAMPDTPVGFGQLHVICRDLEASVAFYRDALGLPEVARDQTAVRLQLGPVTLLLRPLAGAMRDTRAYLDEATVSFDVMVDDLGATVARLEAAGGYRLDEIDGRAGWAVADPDGNPIEVIARGA